MKRAEISYQLDHFQRLVDEHLRGDGRDTISKEISLIRNKVDDPRLYVAVVGEFSSGKSTFINALLRYRLLKDAVKPTTASATYILKGKSLSVDVRFRGISQRFIATPDDYRKLSEFIRKSFGVAVNSLQQIIDAVTSEQSVAGSVSEIILNVPTDYLPEDVVIIDTPGFNPGEEDYSTHFDITRRVVEYVADTALILMPSSQPFSNAVKYFTQEYIRRYISHCIFVLTKMDQKPDEAERKEIIDFVAKHIEKTFNVGNANVFGECALSQVPGINVPPTLKDFFRHWRTQFESFTSFLWDYVAKQRDLIISSHLKRLLMMLISDLKISLTVTRESLSREQKALESTRIADINDVTESMRLNVESDVSNLTKNLRQKAAEIVEQRREQSTRFALDRVVAGKMYKYKSETKVEIIKQIRDSIDSVFSEVNTLITQGLKPKINRLSSAMQQDFNKHYQTLSALPHSKDVLNEIEIKSLEGYIVKLDESSAAISDVQSKGGGKIIGGTVAGAAAAGLVLGPVGAVAGAIAGFIWGGKKSDKLESEQIESIRQKITKEIDNHYQQAANRVNEQLDKIAQDIDYDFAKYCKQHIIAFGDTVKAMTQKHEAKIEVNKHKLTNLTHEIRKLEDLYDNLSFDELLNNHK